MKRAAAIGDNCIDLYDNTGQYYVTGNVLDFAVNIQRMGVSASLISTTGNDKFGRDTVDILRKEKIDISHLYTVSGQTAVSHMTLIDGERTYGDYEEGVLSDMQFSQDDIDFAASHDLIHSAFWGNAHMHLEELRQNGSIISFDYATEWTDPLVESTVPFVDYAFFSFEEKSEETVSFLKNQVERGAKVAIATLGEKGSIAWDGLKLHYYGIMPVIKPVNTVGAGDSYIAGFMCSILNGMSITEAQRKGAETAAEVVSVFEPWTDYKGVVYL